MESTKRTITLTEEESRAYMYLGLAVASMSIRDALWRRQECIVEKGLDIEEKLEPWGWPLEQVEPEELTELWHFRNRIVHGAGTVTQDGTLHTTLDGVKQAFSLEELEQYAGRFWHLRFENRIAMKFEIHTICRCGRGFLLPDQREAFEAHQKTCQSAFSPSPTHTHFFT